MNRLHRRCASRNCATRMPFSDCARTRYGNVSSPRSVSQQSNGDGTEPPYFCDIRARSNRSFALPRNQRAADHVAVPADIFRGGMRHQVDAQFERPLQHRRGERPVAHRHHTRAGADCADCAIAARSVIFISGFDGVSTQINRVFGRIAARHRLEVRHVDVAGFHRPAFEHAADHFAEAPVDIVGRQDVATRLPAPAPRPSPPPVPTRRRAPASPPSRSARHSSSARRFGLLSRE